MEGGEEGPGAGEVSNGSAAAFARSNGAAVAAALAAAAAMDSARRVVTPDGLTHRWTPAPSQVRARSHLCDGDALQCTPPHPTPHSSSPLVVHLATL